MQSTTNTEFKETASSLVLGLLFGSLLAIYLVTDQNPLVTGLSIMLIALALYIVPTGDWREIGIIGGFSLLVSLIAAYLVGRYQFGNVGAVVYLVLWAIIASSVFSYLLRNIQIIPTDRAILSRRAISGEVVNPSSPGAQPVLPFLERPLATIPLYTLTSDAVVKDINTRAKLNVSELKAKVVYNVASHAKAEEALTKIPNRGLVQSRIAKSMGKSVEEARINVEFWESLLDDQIQAETDDVVRSVVRDIAPNPKDLFLNQEDLLLEQRLCDELSRRVAVWGVNVQSLEIDSIIIPGDAWKKPEDEVESKKQLIDYNRIHNLRSAQNSAEADRVRKLIQAVRDSGVDTISPALLEDIIVSASGDADERVLQQELDRWFNDNYKPPASDSGKKP